MYVHDLLIKGGRVVDPGGVHEGQLDIGINGSTITAVSKDIPAADATRVLDAGGRLVTPGFIDLHAHVADGITRHGITPDRAGVLQGVTTIVDGGSLGPHTFHALRRHVLPANRTRVLALLNLSFAGQAWMPELRTMADLDEAMIETVLATNRDLIRGIKVRAISPSLQNIGEQIIDIGIRHAEAVDGPVMLHIGDHGEAAGSAEVTRRIIERLRPGDILTHPYTTYPGGALANGDGSPVEEVQAAIDRGVVIDVGRGGKNFSIANARQAVEAGFVPDTISTDITIMTIHGPVFGLADTASIFLNIGLGLDDVILRVTANPARALGIIDEVGTIEVGKTADLTILEHHENGSYEFHGFSGERSEGSQLLVPVLTVAGGSPVRCELPRGSAMRAVADRHPADGIE